MHDFGCTDPILKAYICLKFDLIGLTVTHSQIQLLTHYKNNTKYGSFYL